MYFKFENIVNALKFQVKGVIHVGGHTGEEIPDYLKYTNNIHIFEPQKECFDLIPNNVKKYNCALGDKEGTLSLNLASNKQSASLLKPKKHIEIHPDVLFEGTMDVDVKTLDSFNIQDCNFLNMDVQGYELHVLKGAKKTLNSIQLIYTEVNMDELYEGNCLIEDMDAWLGTYKFRRIWECDTGCKWGDALYAKD
jgi:FkbM family methyltransferase